MFNLINILKADTCRGNVITQDITASGAKVSMGMLI